MFRKGNRIAVIDQEMDRRTGVMGNIISIVGRSHRDVVGRFICLGLFVSCFVRFVWGEGCGRVVVIRLFMYCWGRAILDCF